MGVIPSLGIELLIINLALPMEGGVYSNCVSMKPFDIRFIQHKTRSVGSTLGLLVSDPTTYLITGNTLRKREASLLPLVVGPSPQQRCLIPSSSTNIKIAHVLVNRMMCFPSRNI